MESKFKVGDRVRLNPETTQGLGYRDFRGKDAVIINAYPHTDLYEISIGNKPISTSVKSNDLVIVEPYDPKTAFMARLQSLLREFDAEIRFLESDTSPAIVFMGHKDEKTRFGEFIANIASFHPIQ